MPQGPPLRATLRLAFIHIKHYSIMQLNSIFRNMLVIMTVAWMAALADIRVFETQLSPVAANTSPSYTSLPTSRASQFSCQ